jgi:DNA (cytosine-5)-methyltransferase 1
MSNFTGLDREIFIMDEATQASFYDNDLNTEDEKLDNTEFKPRGYSVNDKVEEIIDSKINAIGLFSGAGGLDIGVQLAGAKIISSLDFDRDSVATISANKYFSHAQHFHNDIRNVTANDYKNIIKQNNPEKLILVGGPPCQPFSKAGYWVTHERRKANADPRNMIGNYLALIDDIKPDGFLLENVESILHPTNKIAVEDLIETIDKIGYKLIIVKSNALEYGVPQKRKRVFFIASKKNIIGVPLKTHGSEKEILLNPELLPYESAFNWIETTRFWSFLLKLHPDQPSWTISAQPGPWVGPFHWTGRRLRVPEIAALQTFPEDYQFVGSRRSIQKQIGNAVPSLLGKAMVKHLIANI